LLQQYIFRYFSTPPNPLFPLDPEFPLNQHTVPWRREFLSSAPLLLKTLFTSYDDEENKQKDASITTVVKKERIKKHPFLSRRDNQALFPLFLPSSPPGPVH
jgi:hypothetical protein